MLSWRYFGSFELRDVSFQGLFLDLRSSKPISKCTQKRLCQSCHRKYIPQEICRRLTLEGNTSQRNRFPPKILYFAQQGWSTDLESCMKGVLTCLQSYLMKSEKKHIRADCLGNQLCCPLERSIANRYQSLSKWSYNNWFLWYFIETNLIGHLDLALLS